MFKIALSLLSLFALMTNASNTIRRLMNMPAGGVQPIIPMAGVAAAAGYGVPQVPGFGQTATMGAGAGTGVVPGYGAPATGYGAPAMGYGAPAMGAGAPVVPGYGAAAPGYGNMMGAGQTGPGFVVPGYGVPTTGYGQPGFWTIGQPMMMPGQVVPNNGVMPKYEQPGSEGRR